jgi:uncharacterized protein (TIRG00374 family)
LLLLAIAVATLSFPLRIPRWRLLLPEDPAAPLPNEPLWHATTIGFTANNIMPGRAGEVIRAATLARLTSVSFPTAFASLAVERVLDGLVMLALLGVGLVASGFPATQELMPGYLIAPLAWRLGLGCIAFLILAMAAAWRPEFAIGVLRRVTPGHPWGEIFLHFVERVLAGFAALRQPRRAMRVAGWSIVLWLVNAAGFWIGMLAFGIHLSFFAALVLQGVVVVFIAIPSAPGGFGQFEWAIRMALAMYHIQPNLAAAYAIGFHLTTLPPLLLFGAWSLRRIGSSMSSAAKDAEAAE